MLPKASQTIPYSELPQAESKSPLAAEWETYRREVGQLLAAGLEGKYALIRGDEIVGIYDTWDSGRQVGLAKFLLQPHMIHPILRQEPVLRGPQLYRSCRPALLPSKLQILPGTQDENTSEPASEILTEMRLVTL